MENERMSQIVGAYVGFALGDAYGAPFEFLKGGACQGFKPRPDATLQWTDDTHMSLYLGDVILAKRLSMTAEDLGAAWIKWLNDPLTMSTAPGHTCVSAAQAWKNGTYKPDLNRDGCGAVMRALPIALAYSGNISTIATFEQMQADSTHGSRNGWGAAIAYGWLIREMLITKGVDARASVQKVIDRHRGLYGSTTEIPDHLEAMLRLLAQKPPTVLPISALGHGDGGWRNSAALCIGLYAFLAKKDAVEDRREAFKLVVDYAARHDGDSDSTACLAGGLFGAAYGVEALPPEWLDRLLRRKEIEVQARKLAEVACE